jgi:hypothetical protein
MLPPDGAAVPASRILRINSGGTGDGFSRRIHPCHAFNVKLSIAGIEPEIVDRAVLSLKDAGVSSFLIE